MLSDIFANNFLQNDEGNEQSEIKIQDDCGIAVAG